MDRLGDRISTLEARLKQLKARQATVEARKRTVAQRRERRDEVQRHMIVGAIVFQKVASGECDKETLRRWLREGVKREGDRKLFEDFWSGGNGGSTVGE